MAAAVGPLKLDIPECSSRPTSSNWVLNFSNLVCKYWVTFILKSGFGKVRQGLDRWWSKRLKRRGNFVWNLILVWFEEGQGLRKAMLTSLCAQHLSSTLAIDILSGATSNEVQQNQQCYAPCEDMNEPQNFLKFFLGILTNIKKESEEKVESSEAGSGTATSAAAASCDTMSFPSGHDPDGLHYRVQGTFTR